MQVIKTTVLCGCVVSYKLFHDMYTVHGQELDCDTDPVSRALRWRLNDKITPAMGTAKIIWRTKRGVSPACTPSIRQHYAPNTPQYLVRPQYVGVIVLNVFYCSSRIICNQSVRHTIYIEAIFLIVPVVFTLISSLPLVRLVLFQPSAA